jgi:hypothetical protein
MSASRVPIGRAWKVWFRVWWRAWFPAVPPARNARHLLAGAGSTRTAQNLNSGILPNGSSWSVVSRLAAASRKWNGTIHAGRGYFLMPSARIRPPNMLGLRLSGPFPSAGTSFSARMEMSFSTFDFGSFKRNGKP